jgi:hypothetical protein
MKKQSAIDQLVEEITKYHDKSFKEMYGPEITQAKALERFLLHQAYIAGRKNGEKMTELNFNDFLHSLTQP